MYHDGPSPGAVQPTDRGGRVGDRIHAVILAGGEGTRLRPLTYARRKELIPLLDRPLLEYRLSGLRDNGVEDIVLACSQGMHEIEEHFGDGSSLGVRLRYHYEDRPLGSGRAVKEAARAFGLKGTLVVCNGDILTNVDLRRMLARHRGKAAACSISLARVTEPWHFGVVKVDDDLAISRFVEKPPQGEEPSDLVNAGTWLWEPEVLDRIPDDESAVRDGYSERVLFPGIIADGGRVQGFIEDLWIDVGAPDRYLQATCLLLERALRRHKSNLIADESAWIAPDAEVTGPVWLGRDTTIRGGARVSGPTVVGRGAVVGANASIEMSVLWEGVFIGAGTRVANSIIGAGVRIGDGVILDGAILADGASVCDDFGAIASLRLMPGEEARRPARRTLVQERLRAA